MTEPSAIAGVVEEVPDEPFRFRVQSAKTNEKYLVDIQTHKFTGECNCMHYLARIAPKVAQGLRGPEARCKHLRLAREYFLENILPKLALAMDMEEPEINSDEDCYAGNTEYARARNAWLGTLRQCAVYPALRATEVHHSRGKLGRLFMEKRLWIPVSRLGHTFIHDHPNQARAMTWNGVPVLCSKGDWNRQP
jgi:hypothetical protein